jgi:hypothetical protein
MFPLSNWTSIQWVPGSKRLGHGSHLPPPRAEVTRVKLQKCSPSGPLWYVLGWVVVVLWFWLDSRWSCEGFPRQGVLFRSGLPLSSPVFISCLNLKSITITHLCVPYSETFPPPACTIFPV